MSCVQLLFSLISFRSKLFALHVLFLQVVVIELGVEELVIVDPCTSHHRVLFVVSYLSGFGECFHWLVEANSVGFEGFIAIRDHFSP